ncbi:hypothetical protein [Pseudomonas kurunegalensis]|uniref:hypothetical protein n=1 Tax=Pseudomonas kurunegalensis TaxID=485880 RepID=UPI002363FB65|nr:hypothetical protein [Pseudomonas kurunegalensis]MDD2133378.1 hypothetical protein [Pseudomonas kurunegalensis]
MAFTDDNGGFRFECDDAKMSINASTWATRLSQLARMKGAVSILTTQLPDPDYVIGVLSKRAWDIKIVAHVDAREGAERIKQVLPSVRIALHSDIGAKAILIAPDTVWILSGDFGKKHKLDTGVGFHSAMVYQKTHQQLFERAWREARELP